MSKADEADIVVGVDTHLETHTAAICDARGPARIAAAGTGHDSGIRPAAGLGAGSDRARAGCLGGRGNPALRLGLARYLADEGQQVTEIDSSRHIGKHRAGKSDPMDAVRAARELLARPHPAQMAATETGRPCAC